MPLAGPLVFALGGPQPEQSSNIVKLLTAVMGSVQDVENALQQLLTERSLAVAVGAQLDIIGKLVGQPRDGLADDDYRRYCRARVVANRSNGVTEDLIKIISLIVNDTGAVYSVSREGTATARVRVDGIAVSDSLAGIVFSFMQDAASAGVRLVVQWSSSTPANTFRLDSGPGLDVGHLANAEG